MSSYANEILNEKGFNRKLYPELLDKTENRARELYGEDVDLTDDSPTGQFCKQIAYDRAEELELAELVYYGVNVNYAKGFMLDFAIQGSGMTRFEAKKASAARGLRVVIEPKGGTLTAGFIAAKKSDGTQYRTLRDAVDLDGDGIVIVDAEALDTGPQGNAAIGEVTEVRTPSTGVNVTAVTNVVAFTGGRSREDDAALKARYNRVQSRGGAATADAVLSALLSMPDVRAAIVTENDDDDPDENGVPGHAIAPTVLGGLPIEIAQTIKDTKAGGIKSFGSVNVTVKDASGKDQIIGFSYAAVVPIWAEIRIDKNDAFPTDGASQVESLVASYIGGYDSSNRSYPGRGMGEDIIHFALSRSITTPGIDDLTVRLRRGDTGEFIEGNIEIGGGEVAEITPERVEITVVT